MAKTVNELIALAKDGANLWVDCSQHSESELIDISGAVLGYSKTTKLILDKADLVSMDTLIGIVSVGGSQVTIKEL
jgi:hypothetical protein